MGGKLIPPDKTRCQAEKPLGAFRMGGPAFERCHNRPTQIVRERTPGRDGRRGSMSLCDECRVVFDKQVGAATVTTQPLASGSAHADAPKGENS
jgi:hypothetical protein